MEFTDIEDNIIKSPSFQRLRRIKQNGNAYVAYPSATHTRFEHSLGVCHLSKTILSIIERSGFKLEADDKFIIPIIGLLHNITHTPFAFSLQEHMDLFPHYNSEDKYINRFSDMKLDQLIGQDNVKIVLNTLVTKNISELDKPYYKQIIRDVVGANVSDYLIRDAHYIRVDKKFALDRIIDQNCILKYNDNKNYLGIDLRVSYSKPINLLYEIYTLLWVRYLFGATIYFYPTVVATDAMMGKAFRKLIQYDNIDDGFFYDLSDDQVVSFLSDHKDPVVNYVGNRLKNRELFGMAYQINRADIQDLSHFSKIVTYLRGISNLSIIENIENYIADEAGVDHKDIIIYCHNPEMYIQEIDTLVIDTKDRIRPLFDCTDILEVEDIKSAVDRHKRLWATYVYCGNREEKILEKVSEIAKEIFTHPSVLDEVAHRREDSKKLNFYDFKPIATRRNELINNWPSNYQKAYTSLIEKEDWQDIEKLIGITAIRDLLRYENSEINRSLGTTYRRSRKGQLDIRNILTARRMVIASLWKHKGNFYKTQKLFYYGYDKRGIYSYEVYRDCPGCYEKIDYYSNYCKKCRMKFDELPAKKEHTKIFDDGFKKFFFETLKLKTGVYYSREDLLHEETIWLDNFMKSIEK